MAAEVMGNVAQGESDTSDCDDLQRKINSALDASSFCRNTKNVGVAGNHNKEVECRKTALARRTELMQSELYSKCNPGRIGGKRKSKRANKKRRSSRRKSSKSRRRR